MFATQDALQMANFSKKKGRKYPAHHLRHKVDCKNGYQVNHK